MKGFQVIMADYYFRHDGQLWRGGGSGGDDKWFNNMAGLEDPKIFGWDQTAYEQNPVDYKPLEQPIFNVGDSRFYLVNYTNREDVPVRLEGKWDYGRIHTLGSCAGLVVQPGENVKCYVEEVLTQEDFDWGLGTGNGSSGIFYVTYDVGGAGEHKVFTEALNDRGGYVGDYIVNIHRDFYLESVAAVDPNLTDGENVAFTYTVNHRGSKTFLPNSKVFYSSDNRVYELGDLTIDRQNRLNSITVTNVEPKAVEPYYYCAQWDTPTGEMPPDHMPGVDDDAGCLRTERAVKEASIFIKTYSKGLYHSMNRFYGSGGYAYTQIIAQDQAFNVEVTTQGEDAATVDISTDYVPQNGWSVEVAEASTNTQVETKTLPGDTKTLDVSSLEAGTEYVATVVNADSREMKTATFVTAAATPGGGTTPTPPTGGNTGNTGGNTTPTPKPEDTNGDVVEKLVLKAMASKDGILKFTWNVSKSPTKGWTLSADKPGIDGKAIKRNIGNYVGFFSKAASASGSHTMEMSELKPGTIYKFTLMNNDTGESAQVAVTTPAPSAPQDPTDPQIPDEIVTGEVAMETPDTTGNAGVLAGLMALATATLGGLGIALRKCLA